MKTSFQIILALIAAASKVTAYVGFCHHNGCNTSGEDCLNAAEANPYPGCAVYETSPQLDSYYVGGDNGLNYLIYMNIQNLPQTCHIIVRSPANVERSDCGAIVGDFKQSGCYGVHLGQSFMLQYCCGSGDCAKADPGGSPQEFEEFKRMAALGLHPGRAMTMAIMMPGFNLLNDTTLSIDGTQSLDLDINGNGEAEVRSHARDLLVKKAEAAPESCTYQERERYTTLGQAVKASPDITCAANGCDIQVSASVTTGREVNISVGFNVFDVISASTSITFSESKTYSVTATENGVAGESGHMEFTPFILCTKGQLQGSCQNLELTACTPLFVGSPPMPDGQYTFVQTS